MVQEAGQPPETTIDPSALSHHKRRRSKMGIDALSHMIINPILSLLLVLTVLFVSAHQSMQHSQEDATEKLMASANEQADTLSAIWEGQLETLDTVAIGLAEYDKIDTTSTMRRLQRLSDETAFTYVNYASSDGVCYTNDGHTFDVSDREYFKQAILGKQSVQRVEQTRVDGSVLIVLAVPIIKDAQTVGVVQGAFLEDQLAEKLIPDIYDGQAFSVLCREDGFVAVGTDHPAYASVTGNLFTDMNRVRLTNGTTLEMVKADIAAGKTGTIAYETNGEEKYAVYVPLDFYSATGERLVMFNIIPDRLIQSAAKEQFASNALLIGLILLSVSLTFAAYLFSAQKVNKRLVSERNRLLASEEQNRVAMEESGLNIVRYKLKSKTMYNRSPLFSRYGYGEQVENAPDTFIDSGLIGPDCVDDCRAFFDGLRGGTLSSTVVSLKEPEGGYRWYHLKAQYVNDDKGKPYQAIIVWQDVTEQRAQAAVYANWQQSLRERDQQSYMLFHCNLSKGASYDQVEGELLKISFNPDLKTFNERTREYAGRYVHLDDFDAYVSLMNSENLLASYYRGVHAADMHYRERVAEGEYRWLHVAVEMTQCPGTSDVEVFLMYENAAEAKAEEPSVRERIESDSLTGVLNRSVFMDRFTDLITHKQPDRRHALILVDIDDFKRLNESFGHAVGDQALIDIAVSLRTAVRENDLIGRLGGDEFMICLSDVSSLAVVEQRAMRILTLMRKSFSVDIQLSASLGIAVYPDDGQDFNALYHSLDLALYTAKANGRDSFAFYNGEAMKPQKTEKNAPEPQGKAKPRQRRMLIVDRDEDVIRQLTAAFESDYTIEVCDNEMTAIARLQRYGLSLTVVLLSLDIPDVDSFALLDRLHSINLFRAIPVIAMSRQTERDKSLRALQHGANDFILTPIHSELLKNRVDSAVSIVENERLRVQNAYLQNQNSSATQLRSVFENTGTVVVEYDWQKHAFAYDPAISRYLYGNYDGRSLWQIFMSDMVASAQDVKILQQMIYDLANDRNRTTGTLDIQLKTPSKVKHWFTMNAFKRVNDINLASKIILTFLDVNDSILASKKLRFQAEHDALTELYNRTHFLKLVEETVRKRPGGSYLLCCCDINNFRFINERFGREEGDKLLQYSAEKLMSYSEAMNGFAGRLSNDVFAILLPNNPNILERTTAIVQQFFDHYPLKAKITGRVGAYLITDPTMTADSMLDMASVASEVIKGKFAAWLSVYDQSMSEQLLLEKNIADHMENALAEEQFIVYIQPQFHHATGQLVGGEALVRWQDPQKGLVSPGVFIPIFEKNGFITKLDEYVWDKAAQYLSRWIEQGIEPVPISVNVSREDTNDPALCQKLLDIVHKYHIPINLFRLEITETLFAEDTKLLIRVVEQLHDAGFLIEMDDFGSGYSSLNILKDVPVDILKLDMKFFSGEDNLGRGGMIINAVLRMSRWLNIPVIAEGVEARDQADFLLSIGCPTIQGFLYERPMPVEDFEKRFLENRAPCGLPQNPVESELNASSFWNPLSSDSQLFNNFISPAVIFEYYNGECEIIRMNPRFIKEMQINESIMLPACGLFHFLEEDKATFKKAVLDAIRSGNDVKTSVSCRLEKGAIRQFHVTLRMIAKSAERSLIFGMLDA